VDEEPYISLDRIFIRAAGRICGSGGNTEPRIDKDHIIGGLGKACSR